MKALVTGAGGFCGRHLTQLLESERVEVHSAGTRPLDRPRHHELREVTQVETLARIIRDVRPDFVFHLAGVTTATNSADFYRVNAAYAATLLAAMTEVGHGDCSVLFTGSSAEYGAALPHHLPLTEDRCPNPLGHYGISKLAQTQVGMAQAKLGWRVVVVRPFNVIGPGMPERLSIQSFATQISRIRAGASEPTIDVGNLNATRDFIDVRDAVSIYWDAIRSEACWGQVINVCSGLQTPMADALANLLELAGVAADTRRDPSLLRPLESEAHFGSTQKRESLLGSRPLRALTTTLQDVLAYESLPQ